MIITAGTTIVSSPVLDDPNFVKAVIFITEHNENGAMGFVVNKKSPRMLNELTEFANCIPFPLYHGGPVDNEHLYFVHSRPDLIDNGKFVSNGIYCGGDFKQAVAQINSGALTEKDLKIFIGYCGWNKEELEEEIKEGSWTSTEKLFQNIFSDDSAMWDHLYNLS